MIVRTGGLPPSLRSCRLRPERLALQVLQEHAYDSNGNITCDPLRCFEIRYNLLNLATEVIGHDPEDTAAEGTLLSETVYYADGTRAGVTTPDDGYWTTRYIGSLIYEGEPGRETLEGIVTDVSSIFMQVDPMAEKYYGMTSYGYCAGNPVMMVDNLGSQPQSIAYEVVKTFSKKGIQHYLFLSVAPLCAPLSAVLLAGGMVVGDTPITEFSEDDTEGKTTNQDGDDVSGDSTDTEVDFPSSSDEVNSTGGTKIPDSELTPPDKRGHAPKGKDGYPIELHHRGQSQDGPLDEMTRTQHRGVGNFKKNHSNVGTEKSKINRNESNRERREYRKKYWDNGRFGNGNSDGGSH